MVISFLVSLVIVVVCIFVVGWAVHISMNNDETCNGKRIWVTFKQFKTVFDKYADEYECSNDHSCIRAGQYPDPKTYMCAGIVRINENLFYFYTPVGYWMYEAYKDKFTAKKFGKLEKKHFTTFNKYKGEL